MRVVRIATVLTVIFWLIMLLQQAVWLPHALQPRFTQDPLIGGFAVSYAVTSSLKMGFFAAAAAALAYYAYPARRAWPAIALCILFALAFWQYVLVGLPLFFRPPFGDGSLHGALIGYLRFQSTGVWLDLTKGFLLLGCFGLWVVASCRISHASEPKV